MLAARSNQTVDLAAISVGPPERHIQSPMPVFVGDARKTRQRDRIMMGPPDCNYYCRCTLCGSPGPSRVWSASLDSKITSCQAVEEI
jgi:hypothetical protein